MNQEHTGRIATPYDLDRWHFTADADRLVRLRFLNVSQGGLSFDLTGPNGWTVFVKFDIPDDDAVGGIWKIQVDRSLPEITETMALDAATQRGYAVGSPVVELDGTKLGVAPGWGFQVNTEVVGIRGFSIHHFTKNGILLKGAGNNLIQSNIIGADAQSTPNIGCGEDGILILDCSDNRIGGASLEERNVISGNGSSKTSGAGVLIKGTLSRGDVVSGNYIGTNVAGNAALVSANGVVIENAPLNLIGGWWDGAGNVISGQKGHGIRIMHAGAADNLVLGNIIGLDKDALKVVANAKNGIMFESSTGIDNIVGGEIDTLGEGRGNIISGNKENGVLVHGRGTDNVAVKGNYIGTNLNGTLALGNGKNGIQITYAAKKTIIGGSGMTEQNVISGSTESGILIDTPLPDPHDMPRENTIQGNIIGLSAWGIAALPNNIGIRIFNSPDNVIGGKWKSEGNTISDNAMVGLVLNGSKTSNTIVQGNIIGLDTTGSNALANGGNGIAIEEALSTLIGGAGPFHNVIAGNTGNGVSIVGSVAPEQASAANVLENNLIGALVGNGMNGIFISNSGENSIGPDNLITFNKGANEFQNYPVLNRALASPIAKVIGTFKSFPNDRFIIEFFSNTSADPSGNGEGKFYLGSMIVHTDTEGSADFNTGLAGITSSQCVSATAIHEPSENADGDDKPSDDEDGVTMPSALTFGGGSVPVEVSATRDGYLNAWIDLNADGDWGEANEHVLQDVALTSGTNALKLSLPEGGVAGETYARFRFSSVEGLSYKGLAPDGEVEDYQVLLQGRARAENFWILYK